MYTNGSKTAAFDVTLTFVAECTIGAAAPLAFVAASGVLSSAITASSNITVTCTSSTPYNLGLTGGTGVGSLGTLRYMSGTGLNTSTVQFNLFQSSNYTTPWGNVQGTDTTSGTGTGTPQILTVYGQIPVQISPPPDAYKSIVTAVVYF